MHIIKNTFHRIALPPLLPITITLILGILWQYNTSSSIFTLIIFIAGTSLILFALCKKFTLSLKKVASLPLIFFIGAFLYQHQVTTHQNFYLQFGNKPVTVIARVTNIEITKHLKTKRSITLQIQKIKVNQNNKWNAIKKNVLLYTNSMTEMQVGDTVVIKNIVFKSPKNTSFTSYLIRGGIAGTAFVSNTNYQLLHRPTRSFSRWLFKQQQRLLSCLERKLSPHAFSFFSSLFLGNRTCAKEITQQTAEQFKRWGISHFLARSGLHLAIFILIWHTICSLIPISFRSKQIFLVVLSILYFILSWSSASFLRAFALFIFYKLCNLLKTPFHFLHMLTLICFVFLIINPIHLFFLDFQLSFTLTFALSWFNQIYSAKYK